MSQKKSDPPEEPSTVLDDSPFVEPIVLPLEDSIDLHAFAPKDIPSVVEEYIHQCHQAGFFQVRVIHGRGKGIQRRIVQSILAKNSLVSSFKDAPPESGGWGSTVVVIQGQGTD